MGDADAPVCCRRFCNDGSGISDPSCLWDSRTWAVDPREELSPLLLSDAVLHTLSAVWRDLPVSACCVEVAYDERNNADRT